ncbi:MAG TPA: glyoxylate/hydroxypyruvate reductase A, partial [Xanthobacteraceae bacterium]|nr:glyoxylate/hydroxypyruvate reductase A [Xanthobacteraceae bacterium]
MPAGALAKLPNLRLILSLTAGVDTLLGDSTLPNVPIARTADPDGDVMMNETVLLHVLRHHRYMPDYLSAQQRSEWIRRPIKAARERAVGIMGLGSVGLAAAKALAAIGFRVAGWVRQARPDGEIEIFSGREQFDAFLARSEILIDLLPLTPQTYGIINAATLKALPAGAAFINLGRGDHVVEADLIAALDSGHLGAATLDVYPVEPLPKDSPLWRHPKITVMPHVARRLVPEEVASRICNVIREFRAGAPLAQAVDRTRGY